MSAWWQTRKPDHVWLPLSPSEARRMLELLKKDRFRRPVLDEPYHLNAVIQQLKRRMRDAGWEEK